MADEKHLKCPQNTPKKCTQNDHLERLGDITYDQFFKDYLLANRLCIFSCDLTSSWRSRSDWVNDGRPNFEFLEQNFGTATVPVADCGKTFCGSHPKQEMKLAEYLAYLKTQDSTQSLYLKDWHFCKDFPDYKAYETPKYFKSDWLNEYWDQSKDTASDDYRFVYIGPKGSWTPFHADVFRSYSWSANICGRKRWYIYPPGQEEYLYDKLGNLAYDITASEIKDVKKYPKIKQIQEPIIVEQTEGEVIFIPSGWHHQVHNMEDTISINHNWTNACGLIKMWSHLQNEIVKIQKSIEDCREMEDWHQHCQLMLKAMAGMDYSDFVNFLVTISKPRLDFIQQQTNTTDDIRYIAVFEEWKESIKQSEAKEECSIEDYCRFDISMIHKCVMLIQNDEMFKKLDDPNIRSKIDKLLDEIICVLGEDKETWSKLATMEACVTHQKSQSHTGT